MPAEGQSARESRRLRARIRELERGLGGVAIRVARIFRDLERLGLARPDPSGRRLDPAAVSALTPREIEVLRYLVRGERAASIAQKLRIRPNTVNNHTKSIYRKLSVNSRTQLAEKLR